MNEATGVAGFVRLPRAGLKALPGDSAQARAAAFFERHGALFGIRNPAEELELLGATRSPVLTHVTYRQIYRGVPVFAGVLRAIFDRSGELVAVHGVFVPDLALETSSSWSAAAAASTALEQVTASEKTTELEVRDAALLIYRTGLTRGVSGSDHLVWEIEVTGRGSALRELVYVDAHSGEVVDRISGLRAGLQREVSEGDLANVVWREWEAFPTGIADWDDELRAAEEAYNLFGSMTGGTYLSYDGNDAAMRTLNLPSPCSGAVWDGTAARFCSGATADDLVAHEWGHAYVELTSGLLPVAQSGALGEAYADIWGETVDQLNGRGSDSPGGPRSDGGCSSFGAGSPGVDDSYRWLAFEDAGGAVRDLWNPDCYGDPGKVTDPRYHCDPGDGGIHSNSGIPSHAFALLVDGGTYNDRTVTGIGLTRAARIYWEAQNLLTPTSDFVDQADALDTACSALVGAPLYELDTASPGGVERTDSITAADCAEVAEASAAVELRNTCHCGSCDRLVCAGRPFVALDFDPGSTGAQIYEVDPSTEPFSFLPIAGPAGVEINNLGFRAADGLLYGLQLDDGGNDQVVRIDRKGTVFGAGRPPGLPSNVRFDAGDVSADGTTMFLALGAHQNSVPLYKVPLPALGPVTSVAITGGYGSVNDWAYNPADGRLYGGDSLDGQVARLDPESGARTDFQTPGLPRDKAFGGAWFDGTGRLFLYRNSGEIYEIELGDLASPSPAIVAGYAGPAPVYNDGAACVQDVLGVAKQMTAPAGGVPAEITIDVVIRNYSATEELSGLSATDDLSAVFGTYGSDWTAPSISSVPDGFANSGFDGQSDTELIAPGQRLAPGASATITVRLELLTLSRLDANGNYCNQAEVLAQTASGMLVSDLSTDGLDPDPNGDGSPGERDPACVAVGQEPWECRDEAFVAQHDPAQLFAAVPAGGSLSVTPVGPPQTTEINNMGFRKTDQLLYAVRLNAGGNEQVVQIDRNGRVFGLGRPAGLPPNVRFDAGDVSSDGTTLYLGAYLGAFNQRLYTVDLTSRPLAAIPVTVRGAAGAVHDWAYNPSDGLLYGGDSSHGQLAALNPATGFRTDVTSPGFLPRNVPFGGAWFDALGNLYLHRNDGEIHKIDLAGPTLLGPPLAGPGAIHNEATACVRNPQDSQYEPPNGPRRDGLNLHAGEYVLQVTDLLIPGRGFDFQWRRTYRSRFGFQTGLGNNWDHSLNLFVEKVGTEVLVYGGEGRVDVYAEQPDGSYGKDGFFRRGRFDAGGNFLLTHADGTVWHFQPVDGSPAGGKIDKISDRNGNNMLFLYNSSGRLTFVFDTIRRSISISYNADGLIDTVAGPAGRRVEYAYYGAGEAGGSAGDLKSVTTAAVVDTSTGNDFPNGKTTTYTYSKGFADDDLDGNLLTIVDARGNTVHTNEYAATTDRRDPIFDHLTRQIRGQGITDYSYSSVFPSEANGNAVRVAIVNDGVGNVEELYFNDRHERVSARNYSGRAIADQPTTLSTNRPAGKLRASDPEFFEWRWEYNADHLPVTVRRPGGALVRRVYELDLDPGAARRARGDLREIHEEPGSHAGSCGHPQLSRRFEYGTDFHGPQFVTWFTDEDVFETRYEYDPSGNLKKILYPLSGLTEDFEYNGFGQLIRRTYPDGGSGRRVDEWVWDEGSCPGEGLTAGGNPAKTAVCPGCPPSSCPAGRGSLQEARRGTQAGGPAEVTRYEYDVVGNLARVIDPAGNDTLFEVNALNQVVRRSSASVNGSRIDTDFHFDAADNITRQEVEGLDETGQPNPDAGYVVTMEYDALNNQTQVAMRVDDTRDVVRNYEFDGNQDLVREVTGVASNGSQPANVVDTVYDERREIFRVVRGPGSAGETVTEMSYSDTGLIDSIQLAKGTAAQRTWVNTYDCFNRKVSVTDPMGNLTERRYDKRGNVISKIVYGEVTDVPGSLGNVRLAETSRTYDGLGRVVEESVELFDPSTQLPLAGGAAVTTFDYGTFSRPQRRIDPGGNIVTFEWDGGGRLKVRTDPEGNRETFEYGPNDQLITRTELLRAQDGGQDRTLVTRFTYDALDRLEAVTDPLGSVRRFSYDSQGRQVKVVDELGNVRHTVYDGMGRVVERRIDLPATGGTPADSIVSTAKYDENSRLIARIDDNGNVTSYAYDALDRLASITYADGTTEARAYDAAGNVIAQLLPDGTQVVQEYDALDRLVRKDVVPGAGAASTTTFETFAYDGLSEIVRAENDLSRVERAYDSRGALLRETIDGETTSFVRNEAGRKTSMTYPGGRTVAFAYDRNRNLREIRDGSDLLATYEYLGPESPSRVRFPRSTSSDTVTATVVYDGLMRPVATRLVRNGAGTPEVLDDRGYEWDRVGNKSLRRDLLEGRTQAFAYDAGRRMIAATTDDDTAVQQTSYLLDGVGNRLTMTNGECSGTYTREVAFPEPADAQMNQYTTTGCDARTYDAGGSLTAIEGGGARRDLIFDYASRLVGLMDSGSGVWASYAYDAFGRRIAKEVTAGAEVTTTRFFYDDREQVIEEQDGQGVTLATYVYGQGIDRPVVMTRGGSDYFYHADDMGNVVSVTDAQGSVVERVRYGDFGSPELVDASGQVLAESGTGNPYLFNGRRYDQESGLYDYRTRYMEPLVGRFLTRDTLGIWGDSLGLGQGTVYAANNPWSASDPDGRKALYYHLRSGFSDAQAETIEKDFDRAEAMSNSARDFMEELAKDHSDRLEDAWNASVAAKWFGKYKKTRYDKVKFVVQFNEWELDQKNHVGNRSATGLCSDASAWTEPGIGVATWIRLCPPHWGHSSQTRARTVYHEISHHRSQHVYDYDTYSIADVTAQAKNDPWKAVSTAASYHWFADDVYNDKNWVFREAPAPPDPPRPSHGAIGNLNAPVQGSGGHGTLTQSFTLTSGSFSSRF